MIKRLLIIIAVVMVITGVILFFLPRKTKPVTLPSAPATTTRDINTPANSEFLSALEKRPELSYLDFNAVTVTSVNEPVINWYIVTIHNAKATEDSDSTAIFNQTGAQNGLVLVLVGTSLSTDALQQAQVPQTVQDALEVQ
jgi:hypothetical protein